MTQANSFARLPFLVAVAMAAVVWIVGGSSFAMAKGVPASQIESQFDPGQDPYTFPAIKLCCEPASPPPPRRHCHHCGHGHGHGKPDSTGGWLESAVVNCGAPTTRDVSFGTLREAVHAVKANGNIYVTSGASCDMSGVAFGRAVTVQTREYGYGARAQLSGGSCAVISSGGHHSAGGVVFRGLDIEGCLALHSGALTIVETNIAWRGHDAAVRVSSGNLSILGKSTVRAREVALVANSEGSVDIRDARLATMSDADHVVRLNVRSATLDGVQIKGARIGILVDNVKSNLQLNALEVVRSEPNDPYPPSDGGDVGILIGDGQVHHDLPWLSGMGSRQVSVAGSKIAGYNTGIVFNSSSNGTVERVEIHGASTGIAVGRGAYVRLLRNKVYNATLAGISLEVGARGSAEDNTVICKGRGRCVCYGGDCTSRSDYVFGADAFRLEDTDCDD